MARFRLEGFCQHTCLLQCASREHVVVVPVRQSYNPKLEAVLRDDFCFSGRCLSLAAEPGVEQEVF